MHAYVYDIRYPGAQDFKGFTGRLSNFHVSMLSWQPTEMPRGGAIWACWFSHYGDFINTILFRTSGECSKLQRSGTRTRRPEDHSERLVPGYFVTTTAILAWFGNGTK